MAEIKLTDKEVYGILRPLMNDDDLGRFLDCSPINVHQQTIVMAMNRAIQHRLCYDDAIAAAAECVREALRSVGCFDIHQQPIRLDHRDDIVEGVVHCVLEALKKGNHG